MNINILFDYPAWLIILCILCGLVYSGILYYRNTSADFSPFWKRLLAVFRFLSVTLLALLLLAPLVERSTRHVEEPLLLFLQDNSSSLLFAEDSLWYRDQYIPEKSNFLEGLSDAHDVRRYTFGEKFSEPEEIDFSARETNMSEVFREIDARYSNRNIGAVVMAGDGIYNRGVNPLYASANVTYPVYTLALGDTVPRRDVILKNVNHNEITYLGNRFPLEIEVEALQSEGLASRLTVSRNGEELFGENITFTSNHHVENISLNLEADEAGMQHYVASLSPVEDEVSLDNNSQDFFIDVIDGRQQVLILANSPHPDVGALKEALVSNDHYEADVSLFDEFDDSPEAYDLIIMHQLPSDNHPVEAFLQRAEEAGLAVLFVIGSQTDLNAFNQLGYGLTIQLRSEEATDASPAYNQAFVLFSLQEATRNLFDELPPLKTPFGNYEIPGGAHVLLNQKIGAVRTDDPLIMFHEAGERRTGIITGEGVWLWRLHTYLRQDSHEAFDEMVSRMVNFLAVQEDRRLFRVHTDNLIYENESALFEAELYNRSYELINEPEVQLTVTREDGTEFPYVMGRTANAYRIDAGTFEPGTYDWEARVQVGDDVYADEGIFNVVTLDLEGLRTIADHRLLNQLAENTGAKMFYPNQWNEMAEDIRGRDDIKPRMYAQKEFVEIINLKPLFFIILTLLAVEWFVRKRSGSY